MIKPFNLFNSGSTRIVFCFHFSTEMFKSNSSLAYELHLLNSLIDLGADYMIQFYQDETSTFQPGRISPFNYMKKSIFITVKRDRFPLGICLQNLIDSHLFKNVNKMMKYYKDICLLYCSQTDVISVLKIQ